MKKVFCLMLCALLVLSFLTAASADMDKKKVVIWSWGVSQLAPVTEAYFAAHPDLDWELEEVYVSADDYLMKLQQAYATGGDMPDILLANMPMRGIEFSMDIWDDLEGEPYNFSRDLILDYEVSVTTDVNDRLVALDSCQNPAFIAYKRDLAREYLGTDDRAELEAMFTTYDDYITVGTQVYEKSGGTVTLFPSLQDFGFMMQQQKNDVSIVNENNEIDLKEMMHPILEMLEKARDNHVCDTLNQWSPQWYAAFGQKTSIFFPIASWGIIFMIEPNDPEGIGNWGALMPVGGGYSLGGTAYGIYKGSEMKEEAWDYIHWCMATVEGAQSMKEVYYFTTLKEAYEDPAYTEGTLPHFGDIQINKFMMEEVASQIKAPALTMYDRIVQDAFTMVMQMMTSDPSLDANNAYDYMVEDLQMKIFDVIVK